MAKVQLRIELDEKLVQAYERQSDQRKKIETVLSERLVACQTHNSQKPLYINDDYRRTIEGLLKRNLNSPLDLVKAIERLVDVDVSGAAVSLPPPVLERVRSRCFGRPLKEVVQEEVVRGLEEFAGLRG
jgi:hypothetical protein